jgi:hypothetical protein
VKVGLHSLVGATLLRENDRSRAKLSLRAARREALWYDVRTKGAFMSSITLEVPDELAERLHALADRLPRILDLGLRALTAESEPEYTGAAEVLELLARLPSPEEVLALRPSPALAQRVTALLEKNRTGGLSPEEEVEWQRLEYLEHLVRIAKARAATKLVRP